LKDEFTSVALLILIIILTVDTKYRHQQHNYVDQPLPIQHKQDSFEKRKTLFVNEFLKIQWILLNYFKFF